MWGYLSCVPSCSRRSLVRPPLLMCSFWNWSACPGRFDLLKLRVFIIYPLLRQLRKLGSEKLCFESWALRSTRFKWNPLKWGPCLKSFVLCYHQDEEIWSGISHAIDALSLLPLMSLRVWKLKIYVCVLPNRRLKSAQSLLIMGIICLAVKMEIFN